MMELIWLNHSENVEDIIPWSETVITVSWSSFLQKCQCYVSSIPGNIVLE